MKKSDFIVYPFKEEFVVVNTTKDIVVKLPEKSDWGGITPTPKLLRNLFQSLPLEDYSYKHHEEVITWWDEYKQTHQNSEEGLL